MLIMVMGKLSLQIMTNMCFGLYFLSGSILNDGIMFFTERHEIYISKVILLHMFI